MTILASVKEGPQNDAKLIYRLFSSEQYFKQVSSRNSSDCSPTPARSLPSGESDPLLLFVFLQGLVGVRFFKNGQWMDVAVDTRIPCLDGKPAFVQACDIRDDDDFDAGIVVWYWG